MAGRKYFDYRFDSRSEIRKNTFDMTIKSKLLTAFAVLITLVVVMGTALVYFGLQNWKLSSSRVQHYSKLFFWREIQQTFDAQWKDLNYYMILGDESEKDKSKEQADLIAKRVSAAVPSWKELDEWYAEYKMLDSLVNESIASSSRESLFQKFSGELNDNKITVQTKLEGFIDFHAKSIDTLEKEINNINTFGIVFSVAVGLLTIVIGSLMSFFIYRSISVPLEALQAGVLKIGEGDMDHRLTIESQDEIGKLAAGFNQMVQNLKTLQLQIMQMDRMSSIGQLAGGVAHEINNPLTGVLGQAQLLLEKMPDGDPCRYNVERIESAAQRCRQIVRALLDFARDKNYNFTLRGVDKLIDETLDFSKSEMDLHSIKVVKIIPPNLPMIKVSAGHIQQVFLNIMNNAVHAMGNDGILTITAKLIQGFIEVSFSDTGKGIKKDNIGHVFDPFFTTKDIGQGTGLGLTISYGIIQKHNGEIFAQSEGEGKGATFIIRLPL